MSSRALLRRRQPKLLLPAGDGIGVRTRRAGDVGEAGTVCQLWEKAPAGPERINIRTASITGVYFGSEIANESAFIVLVLFEFVLILRFIYLFCVSRTLYLR